jgi:hypothetical protein
MKITINTKTEEITIESDKLTISGGELKPADVSPKVIFEPTPYKAEYENIPNKDQS